MNQLPFSEKHAENLNYQIGRVELGKASLIIYDGGVGEGKTTKAVQDADYINARHRLPPISLETKNSPQIAMGAEEFLKKLKLCHAQKLPVIIYDEAGDFNRRGALTKINSVLNRVFETYRGFKIIVMLVLPSFNVLDNSLFDKGIPRLLVNCYGRTKRQGNIRAYGVYRMSYIRAKMAKLIIKKFAYAQQSPNYRGHFKNLSPARIKALDNLSTKSKLGELDKGSIKLEGLKSTKELMNATGLSYQRIHKRLKLLGIKETRNIGLNKYYSPKTIEQLNKWEEENPDKRRR